MMISTQHHTESDPNYPYVINGDLSMHEHIPGIYFLGYTDEDVESAMKYGRGILERLIMDTDEEDTDKEGQEDASNNCGLEGWKVLLTAFGLFFTLALVVRSSIS
ncbi:uncharacterized protein LOC125478387 [Pyrus x bretschneideri]|uniref:uncharacterized protein LOC125478387 n=1 Tax=Pyrus x bretschneideri TaxID=225117 RepID=UPI00202FBBEA|nr:uncharacterized protein LOC125478387 [Pyrus x bretschneideri]